jgi:hypothetical protein
MNTQLTYRGALALGLLAFTLLNPNTRLLAQACQDGDKSAKMLKRFDANQNGQLDPEEQKAADQSRQELFQRLHGNRRKPPVGLIWRTKSKPWSQNSTKTGMVASTLRKRKPLRRSAMQRKQTAHLRNLVSNPRRLPSVTGYGRRLSFVPTYLFSPFSPLW